MSLINLVRRSIIITALAGMTGAVACPPPSHGTRNWWENMGQNGSMYVQPFYSSATWDRSSAMYNQLFSRGGSINLFPNYAAPFYIGNATDPTGTVTDGAHTITVHLPAGVQVEQPTSPGDQSIGGVDRTKPYLFWNISNATIDGNPQGTWRQGSVIRGTYGFVVGDASGLILEDIVVGTTSQNAMGNVQEYELQQALASSSYVIQHMLAFQAPLAFFNNSHIWPLVSNDVGGSGLVPEGTVIGIPFSDTRPAGKTRGWYLLYDNLKQYGWMFYNTGPNSINLPVIPLSSSTQPLANDIGNSISDVLTHAAILANQQGPGSIKGFTAGATSPYPSPPSLDYSPTGGVPVLPSTFGAWYPGGYNVPSVP